MTTLSLADARAGFSRLIESANSTHERFEVTRNGRRMAILLSAELHDGEGHSADDVREAMARRRSATD